MPKSTIDNKLTCAWLLVPFLIALFFPPYSGPGLFNPEPISSSMKYLALFSGVLVLVVNYRKITLDALDVLLAIVIFTMLFSTTNNKGDTISVVTGSVKYILTYSVIKMYLRHEAAFLFRWSTIIISILIIINLMTMVLIMKDDPEGMRFGDNVNMWFLGNKNSIRNYIFPALACSLIYEKHFQKRKPVLTRVLCVVSVGTLYVVDSMTPLLILVACIVVYALQESGMIQLTSRSVLAVYCVSLSSVLVLPSIDFFKKFITEFLHRSITYSGRTEVWSQAFASIGEHLWLGVGLQQGARQGLLDAGGWRSLSHAHNAAIDLLYKYGLICLIAAAGMLILCCKKLYQSREFYPAKIIALTMGAFLLCGIFGELTSEFFIFILAVAYNIEFMDKVA